MFVRRALDRVKVYNFTLEKNIWKSFNSRNKEELMLERKIFRYKPETLIQKNMLVVVSLLKSFSIIKEVQKEFH